jgi:hypothetical protein
LTNFHCTLRLAGLAWRAPDEDCGSTIERDFAVDSLQVQQNANSPIQLVIADRREFYWTAKDRGAF